MAYDEARQRIDSQSADDRCLAKRALCWISYAKRLLSADELCCALAIQPGDKSLNTDNLYDIEDILSVSAGLITIDEGTSIVRLVHYTAQEYFERVRLDWSPEAQLDIAEACLTYLCFDTFQSGAPTSNEAFGDRLAENVFWRYSATFWGYHVHPVQGSRISELAMGLLRNEALLENSTQGATFQNQRTIPWKANAFHVVTLYDLQVLATYLIQDKGHILQANTKEEHGETPLSWAARYGHEEMVKLLLEIEIVDPDSRDNFRRTPLAHAAENGHESIVRILLKHPKVDINSKDYVDHRTPFLTAAMNDRESVVKLLLSENVDIESRDGNEYTALVLAAREGCESVVKFLISQKANLEPEDFIGATPLSWAATNGHTSIVKLLIDEKVDLESKDQYGSTPLLDAALSGHESVVRLLLSHGANIETKDEADRTPLICAAKFGHASVVRVLLSEKFNLESKDDSGCTALSHAKREGKEEIVGLLRDAGAVEEPEREDQETG